MTSSHAAAVSSHSDLKHVANLAGHEPSYTLEMVSLDQILIHEVHDPTRAAPLIAAIDQDGVQRNPVIVARNHQGPLIHLDGANRLTALSKLGCTHVAAQVINYPDPMVCQLDTWLHLAPTQADEVRHAATSWSEGELIMNSPETVTDWLVRGRAAAALLFADGTAIAVCSSIGLVNRIAAMRQLTDLYTHHTVRASQPSGPLLRGLHQRLTEHPEMNVCIAFAPISKADVITLAHNMGMRVPAGITRHVLTCGRVLGINAPLDLLRAPRSTAEKNHLLHQMLTDRRQRVYEERTIYIEEY